MRHSHTREARNRPGRSRRWSAWASLAAGALLLAACQGGGTAASGAGGGADYPEGPITFIVPFSAGGPTDTVTRLITEPMAAELEAEIVVQNVEGAGGTV